MFDLHRGFEGPGMTAWILRWRGRLERRRYHISCGQKRLRRSFRQSDERFIGPAIGHFADRQMEGARLSSGIARTVKLTDEPAPRAAKSASMNPPFPPAAETSE
jgi:hypothetical protein